jgi:hypothetical protein
MVFCMHVVFVGFSMESLYQCILDYKPNVILTSSETRCQDYQPLGHCQQCIDNHGRLLYSNFKIHILFIQYSDLLIHILMYENPLKKINKVHNFKICLNYSNFMHFLKEPKMEGLLSCSFAKKLVFQVLKLLNYG